MIYDIYMRFLKILTSTSSGKEKHGLFIHLDNAWIMILDLAHVVEVLLCRALATAANMVPQLKQLKSGETLEMGDSQAPASLATSICVATICSSATVKHTAFLVHLSVVSSPPSAFALAQATWAEGGSAGGSLHGTSHVL